MSNIEKVIAGITIDASGEDEAEWAFAERLDELLEEPAPVDVAGQSLLCESVEATPDRARARAVVTDGEQRWRVNLDLLRFDPGTPEQTVVRAYRHWLGYGRIAESGSFPPPHRRQASTMPSASPAFEDFDDENDLASARSGGGRTGRKVDRDDMSSKQASRAVSPDRLNARAADLKREIDDALTTLEQLDLSELEAWLGDDDPWGHNEQYWPDGMYVYRDQTDRLDGLATDVGRLVDAGVYEKSRRLSEMILYGLESLIYDYFCPEEARYPAASAVEQWLRSLNALGESKFDPDRTAGHLMRWLEYFELHLRDKRVVAALPEAMERPLIDELEQFLASDGEEYRRASWERGALSLLTELRSRRDELDLLWERLSPDLLNQDAVEAIADWWVKQGDISRAIEVSEAWLQHAESTSSRVMTSRVEQRHRQLLSESGRGNEAIDQLWNSFTDNPMARTLRELLELAPPELRDDFRDRAVDIVEEPHVLVKMAAEFEPFDSLVRRIEETDLDELRDVSSWTLQEAAPNLKSEWPETAAKVYTALGWRHVDRGKAKYYHLSVEAFEEARDLYRKLGREDVWQQVVDEVSSEHGRKYKFMPGFRRIADDE